MISCPPRDEKDGGTGSKRPRRGRAGERAPVDPVEKGLPGLLAGGELVRVVDDQGVQGGRVDLVEAAGLGRDLGGQGADGLEGLDVAVGGVELAGQLAQGMGAGLGLDRVLVGGGEERAEGLEGLLGPLGLLERGGPGRWSAV